MLPAGRPATSSVHFTTSCNTQPRAPEGGQNNCPKHVELIGIFNKPLLLHLVFISFTSMRQGHINIIPIYVFDHILFNSLRTRKFEINM